jgi:hypothetical protein
MFTTETKATTPTQVDHAPLQLADRCDSCGAQAFVAVQLDGAAAELLFCGHHYRRHESALAINGARVHDERSKINVKPSLSANAE